MPAPTPRLHEFGIRSQSRPEEELVGIDALQDGQNVQAVAATRGVIELVLSEIVAELL